MATAHIPKDPQNDGDKAHALKAPRVSACPVPWQAMQGDDRKRYCDHCTLYVHNLSAMPRREADSLLARADSGERVCVAYLADDEGNVINLSDRKNGESCVTDFRPLPEKPAAPMAPSPLPARADRWTFSALLASLAAGMASMLSGCVSTPPLPVSEPVTYTLPPVLKEASTASLPPWAPSAPSGPTRLSSAPPPVISSAPPNRPAYPPLEVNSREINSQSNMVLGMVPTMRNRPRD